VGAPGIKRYLSMSDWLLCLALGVAGLFIVNCGSGEGSEQEIVQSEEEDRKFISDICVDDQISKTLWEADWMSNSGIAMLIRDRLRRLVGCWGEDNLEFTTDSSLLDSI